MLCILHDILVTSTPILPNYMMNVIPSENVSSVMAVVTLVLFHVFHFSSLVLPCFQKCKFVLCSLNQKLVYELTLNSGHYNPVLVSLLLMECTEHQILLPPKGQYFFCYASKLFVWIMEEVSFPFLCSEVEAPLLVLVLDTWEAHLWTITVVMLNQRMWER